MSLLSYVLMIFLTFSDGTETTIRLDHEFHSETGCIASRVTASSGLVDFDARTILDRPLETLTSASIECKLVDPQK